MDIWEFENDAQKSITGGGTGISVAIEAVMVTACEVSTVVAPQVTINEVTADQPSAPVPTGKSSNVIVI